MNYETIKPFSFLLFMLVALAAFTNGDQALPGRGTPLEKNKHVAELEKQIAGQENQPAEEVYKNIQLLKGMPAARLLRVMEIGFNGSLGVDCTHCHVPGQWEKDEKEPKQSARKMWRMQTKLNQELQELLGGKGVVNCYTCHRGQTKPALNPPPSQ